MVAKSYQSLEQVGEPYIKNGRQYVQVRTKSGTLKQVRFYTEKEYLKMYPDEKIETEDKIIRFKQQKEVLGFGDEGFITIFKGNTYEDKEYFKESKARYARMWGWYFISTDVIPDDLPKDVEPIRLPWNLVGNEDGTLKNEDSVTAAVESLIYEPDISEYQGKVGDRLDLVLTIESAISLDGYYGPSTLYTMRDEEKNIFIWITASTKIKLEEQENYHLKGTVKEHKFYKGKKQTILTRCALVNK